MKQNKASSIQRLGKMVSMLSERRPWFAVNADAEIPEMLIYDVIGTGFWGEDAVSPAAFRQALQEIETKHDRMNLRINSPGGLVHDGFAIFNAVKESPLQIDVYIDGLAASVASWLAMAGNRIFVSPQAEVMIHDAWSFVIGTAAEMRKEADHLDSLNGMIQQIYTQKTGLDRATVAEMMAETTWMSGEEAVELGFADELTEASKAAACAFDLDPDILPGLPTSFRTYQAALKKRDRERNLRDAGFSRSEAARRASAPENRLAGIPPAELQSATAKAIQQEIAKWTP